MQEMALENESHQSRSSSILETSRSPDRVDRIIDKVRVKAKDYGSTFLYEKLVMIKNAYTAYKKKRLEKKVMSNMKPALNSLMRQNEETLIRLDQAR